MVTRNGVVDEVNRSSLWSIEMKAKQPVPKTVDEYIAGFPDDVQDILQKVRMTIKKAAPDAVEKISYQIVGFILKGNLLHFAAYKKHIGLYPAPEGSERFNKKLSAYRAAKSTVRFPLDEPIPYDLITEIVKLRVRDNLKRAEARNKKK
jgi:uncharacterized protein YdhG (YjbR/CyaY superfamily)